MADSRGTTALRPDSVGRLAVASTPTGFAEEPLADFRRRLSGARHEALDLVLVLDAGGLYTGAADLRDVMAGPAEARLGTLVRAGWPHVSPETDQEHAAEAAIAAGVAALPVVDAYGKALGCLPAVALVEVLAREHREDLHRLTGILREGANARHALEDPPLWRVSRRLPWLLVGLVLSAVAAMVMATTYPFWTPISPLLSLFFRWFISLMPSEHKPRRSRCVGWRSARARSLDCCSTSLRRPR